MLGFITKATSALATTSAHRPIHFIIVTALLATIAYLSVVDEYVPENLSNPNNISVGINYYHPPGSTDYKNWIQIDDITQYPNANQITIAPLRFRKVHNNDQNIPTIDHSYQSLNQNERILILPTDQIQSHLQSINTITYKGITWKARNNNPITKYYEYLKNAIVKINDLIKNAESFDILLITVAYLSMWYTIIKVFLDMRKVGSNFWLAFSTIISSTFAFLFALVATTKILEIKVPLISLSEGIPFLVAIIGFKHKVSIASEVQRASNSSLDVKTIVSSVITSHTVSMLRDHVAVIGVLIVIAGYAPHLVGLKNFCILGALILSIDLLLVYTFFSAILALKIEINRARRTEDLKDALEEEGISSLVAQKVADQASSISHPHDSNMFTKTDSSIVSFKVAMVATYLAIHVFWFGSSWLYSSTSNPSESIFSNSPSLSKSAVKHITVSSNGTIVTVLSPRTYMPLGTLIIVEENIFFILEKISHAIQDSLISKFLLFAFAISISTNAYFLNASRVQVSANNKLLEKEISRPKSRKNTLSLSSPSSPITPLTPLSASSKAPSSKSSSTIVVEDDDSSSDELIISAPSKQLPLDECIAKLKEGKVKSLTDNEVSSLVVAGKLPLYALEKQLADNTRAVVVRRKAIAKLSNAPVLDTDRLPYEHYDYDRVFGACCENVIGFMPIPVGVAGPLLIDGKPYHIPMATTEGCLVASTMRGCKAINAGGGVQTVLTQDGMTRGPCVSFPSLLRAGAAKLWIDSEDGQKTLKKAFNSTSRFARLQHVQTAMAGTLLFIRFRTTTGDAMGMNMISKGVEYSLKYMVEECGWDDMDVISLSGNYCTDKKAAAINWIEGRGKSVVAEARIPAEVVQKVLKSDVNALVELNISKNLIGSAMAGSIGGFNAHAANLVTAVFLACGQDPAQNVESSNCITLMNNVNGDLQVSVSMPSIEVGTIGGGTILDPQGAMLDLLGVRGPHPTNPGDNARQLARIVASTVLAAELSLCSALAAGHLVQSHMQHNRKGGVAAAPAPVSNGSATTATAAITTTASATPNGSTKLNGNSNGKAVGATDIELLKEGAINCIKS
ncbi:3-hydroxy-3-methyl-glutaryl coenzyme A reductase (HMG-CoA) [Scheffersomyces coipomensis]|uniref:3-hydroxy-3-methyl-glutaryl coenzyme A reductase (HMG-CoA) n=1 Tax=Scheffersomyces coipomensis TaxID=1788519 RepID=UPI00315D06DE